MQFASFGFVFFFTVVVLAYFSLASRFQKLLLLLASLGFYASFGIAYLPAAIVLVLFSFLAGKKLERTHEETKKLWLTVFIFFQVLVLAGLKYTSFFAALSNLDSTFSFVAPIGISFQTLMAISYLVEIRSGRFKAQGLLDVSLYLFFFPQLVAGPIERPQKTIPQFQQIHVFDYARIANGLKLISFGLLKKQVIANRLAIVTDSVFGSVYDFSAPQLLLAVFLYSFQIYADFAGYTDIALGLAEVLGVQLTPNFDRPYFSQSVTEFWQRWHISLSTWLRDYIYFPLARWIRTAKLRWAALLMTFVASGLWHGAAWPFLIWGTIHGLFLVYDLSFGRNSQPVQVSWWRNSLHVIATFLAVTFSWIFFRTNTTGDALHIISQIPSAISGLALAATNIEAAKSTVFGLGFSTAEFALVSLAIIGFLLADFSGNSQELRNKLNKMKPAWRWAFYYALVAGIIFLGFWGNSSFIYFGF